MTDITAKFVILQERPRALQGFHFGSLLCTSGPDAALYVAALARVVIRLIAMHMLTSTGRHQ